MSKFYEKSRIHKMQKIMAMDPLSPVAFATLDPKTSMDRNLHNMKKSNPDINANKL